MAYLVLDVAGERREIRIDRPVTLGRQPGLTVVLEDQRLSREHSRVWFDGRLYRVEDLGSRNGTYVNGERLAEPRLLRPGDKIRLGETVLTFQLDASEVSLSPETHDDNNPDAVASSLTPPRMVRSSSLLGSGPAPFIRRLLNLLLLSIFVAGVWGSKTFFIWLLARTVPR